MRARLRQFGGELDIKTNMRGTTLFAVVPLTGQPEGDNKPADTDGLSCAALCAARDPRYMTFSRVCILNFQGFQQVEFFENRSKMAQPDRESPPSLVALQ